MREKSITPDLSAHLRNVLVLFYIGPIQRGAAFRICVAFVSLEYLCSKEWFGLLVVKATLRLSCSAQQEQSVYALSSQRNRWISKRTDVVISPEDARFSQPTSAESSRS